MPKSLIRVVVFFLLPGLLFDPATAHAALDTFHTHPTSVTLANNLTETQALMSRGLFDGKAYSMKLKNPSNALTSSFHQLAFSYNRHARKLKLSFALLGRPAVLRWALPIGVLGLAMVMGRTWFWSIPIIFGICDRAYIDRRLADQEANSRDYEEEERARKDREEKAAEEREKERKKRAEEFDKSLKDFVENMERVVEDDGKLNRILDDLTKHDIAKYVVRALGRLTDEHRLKVDTFSRDIAADLISNNVFTEADRAGLEEALASPEMKETVDGLIAKTQESFIPVKPGIPQKVIAEDEHTHEGLSHAQMHQQGIAHQHEQHHQTHLPPSGPSKLHGILIWAAPLLGALGYLGYHVLLLHGHQIAHFLLSPWTTLAGAVGVLAAVNIGQGNGGAPAGNGQLVAETEQDPIKRYTVNLNDIAKAGKTDESPFIEKIQDLDRLLATGSKRNVVVVGDPGITRGFIQAVAQDVATKDPSAVPPNLRNREFLYLNVASLLYLMAEIGRFESTIQELSDALEKAVKQQGKQYVFVFDFQQLYWIKRERSNLLSNVNFLFKNILDNKDIPVIGLCNEKHYDEFFSAASGEELKRNFEQMPLKDLPGYKASDFVRAFLRRAVNTYPKLKEKGIQRIFAKNETLDKALTYVRRHMPYGQIPGKLEEMIDQLLTERGERAATNQIELYTLRRKMSRALIQLQRARQKEDADEIRYLKETLNGYGSAVETLKAASNEKKEDGALEMTLPAIVNLIGQETGIPPEKITQEQDDKLDNYIPNIRKKLIGQTQAVELTYKAFKRRHNEMSEANKPTGAFIFVGGTGVGKTELAKAIDEQYFGSESNIVRFDMSEFMEANAEEKLIGAPPGYVGYEEGGQLTNAVRKRPFSVVLFDEIEKAHPKVYDLLLQILDKGELTDSHGRTVDFRNTIIIMTSNLGMTPEVYDMYAAAEALITMPDETFAQVRELLPFFEDEKRLENRETFDAFVIDHYARSPEFNQPRYRELKDSAKAGRLESKRQELRQRLEAFKNQKTTRQLLETLATVQYQTGSAQEARLQIIDYTRSRIRRSVDGFFARRPELLPRLEAIGDVVVFDKLTLDDLQQILDIKLAQQNEALAQQGLQLVLTPALRGQVIQEGYDPERGARPLQRAFKRVVLAPLSEEILKDTYHPGDVITADWKDGRVIFEITRQQKEEENLDTPLIQSIEQAFNAGAKPDLPLADKLFGLPLTAPLKPSLSASELPVDLDAEGLIQAAIAQQGRALNNSEKQQIKEEVQSEIQAQKELLNKYFENLSLKALENKSAAGVVRGEDVASVVRVLEQRKRNAPFLVNHDVSTLNDFTAEFAREAVQGEVPGYERLRFLKLNLERFSSQFTLIGKIEDQMRRFLDAIEADDQRKNMRTIIVMDYDELEREIPIYRGIDTRAVSEPFNLGFFMIPFMGRKDVRVMMTTKKQDIQNNEAFDHFFTKAAIGNLDQGEAIERFHLFEAAKAVASAGMRVLEYPFSVLKAAAALLKKELAKEPLMGLLQRLFEHVSSRKLKNREALMTTSVRAKARIAQILQEFIDEGTGNVTLDQLLHKEELISLIREVQSLDRQFSEVSRPAEPLTLEDVQNFLVDRFNKDKKSLSVDEKKNLLNLELALNAKIIDQEPATLALARAVRIGKAGLKEANKPIGTFLFPGPTGVGKTETVYRLGNLLGMNVIRMDMTEFKKPQDVAKLIGAPPGYVGHEDSNNWLTTKVIRQPRSIILFDEIDKLFEADVQPEGVYGKTVLDIVLQMLEDGRLTDAKGNTADFSECVIVFTSNGGVNIRFEKTAQGWVPVIDNGIYRDIKEAIEQEDEQEFQTVRNTIHDRVDAYHRRFLRPEFLNRLDDIIIFDPLRKNSLVNIINLFLAEFAEQMAHRYQLTFGRTEEERQAIIQYLMGFGFAPDKGARGIKNVLNKDLKDRLGEFLDTQHGLLKDDKVYVLMNQDNSSFEFQVEKSPEISLKEKLKLSAAEEAILTNMVEGLNGLQGQFPTLDAKDIEPWLEPVPLTSKDKGKDVAFSAAAETRSSHDNDYTHVDTELNPFIKAKLQQFQSKTESPDLTKAVGTWLKEAVTLAKRENIQQTAWREGGRLEQFYDLETGALAAIKDRYLDSANKGGKTVRVGYEEGAHELTFEVRFNSALPQGLYRRLFEEPFQSTEEVSQRANRLLQGILKAQVQLREYQVEIGFSCPSPSETTLWIKIPPGGSLRMLREFLQKAPTGSLSPEQEKSLLARFKQLAAPSVQPATGNSYADQALQQVLNGLTELNPNLYLVERSYSAFESWLKKDGAPRDAPALQNLQILLKWIADFGYASDSIRVKAKNLLEKMPEPSSGKTANPATSLLGLAKDVDPQLEPLPEKPVPPEVLQSMRESMGRIAPDLAKVTPLISEAYYFSHIGSYAAIDTNQDKPVLLLDKHLSGEIEPSLQEPFHIIQAMLLNHEGLQYRLRKSETGAADLTEEIAMFAEVDRAFWEKVSPAQWKTLMKLAAHLDSAEPSRPDRLGPSLERLIRYSIKPDAPQTWKMLAEELKSYPRFSNQVLDISRLNDLRSKLSNLKKEKIAQADVSKPTERNPKPKRQTLKSKSLRPRKRPKGNSSQPAPTTIDTFRQAASELYSEGKWNGHPGSDLWISIPDGAGGSSTKLTVSKLTTGFSISCDRLENMGQGKSSKFAVLTLRYDQGADQLKIQSPSNGWGPITVSGQDLVSFRKMGTPGLIIALKAPAFAKLPKNISTLEAFNIQFVSERDYWENQKATVRQAIDTYYGHVTGGGTSGRGWDKTNYNNPSAAEASWDALERSVEWSKSQFKSITTAIPATLKRGDLVFIGLSMHIVDYVYNDSLSLAQFWTFEGTTHYAEQYDFKSLVGLKYHRVYSKSKPSITSLLGLEKDADPQLEPLPDKPVPPEVLQSMRQSLEKIAPDLAQVTPEVSEAYYFSHIGSYAAIDSNQEKPVLLLDKALSQEMDPSLLPALQVVQAMLLTHEGLQYRLRQRETGHADLTEEIAMFTEVDRTFWDKVSPNLWKELMKLAAHLDQTEPDRPDRLGPSLERLIRYSVKTDSPQTWEMLAEELKTYPRFADQTLDVNRLKDLRAKLDSLKMKTTQPVPSATSVTTPSKKHLTLGSEWETQANQRVWKKNLDVTVVYSPSPDTLAFNRPYNHSDYNFWVSFGSDSPSLYLRRPTSSDDPDKTEDAREVTIDGLRFIKMVYNKTTKNSFVILDDNSMNALAKSTWWNMNRRSYGERCFVKSSAGELNMYSETEWQSTQKAEEFELVFSWGNSDTDAAAATRYRLFGDQLRSSLWENIDIHGRFGQELKGLGFAASLSDDEVWWIQFGNGSYIRLYKNGIKIQNVKGLGNFRISLGEDSVKKNCRLAVNTEDENSASPLTTITINPDLFNEAGLKPTEGMTSEGHRWRIISGAPSTARPIKFTNPATSLLGLAKDADPHLPPIPHTPLPPEALKEIQNEVARIAPAELAQAVPQIEEAYYASHVPSYAVIDSHDGIPVCTYDEHLQGKSWPRFESGNPQFAYNLVRSVQAFLWIHEGSQYRLRQSETERADLTEELALFAEVDLPVWRNIPEMEKGDWMELAKTLDRAEAQRPDRFGPSLARLEKYEKLPDEQNTWEAVATELQKYPQFTGENVDWNRFQSLRAELKTKQSLKVHTLASFLAEKIGNPELIETLPQLIAKSLVLALNIGQTTSERIIPTTMEKILRVETVLRSSLASAIDSVLPGLEPFIRETALELLYEIAAAVTGKAGLENIQHSDSTTQRLRQAVDEYLALEREPITEDGAAPLNLFRYKGPSKDIFADLKATFPPPEKFFPLTEHAALTLKKGDLVRGKVDLPGGIPITGTFIVDSVKAGRETLLWVIHFDESGLGQAVSIKPIDGSFSYYRTLSESPAFEARSISKFVEKAPLPWKDVTRLLWSGKSLGDVTILKHRFTNAWRIEFDKGHFLERRNYHVGAFLGYTNGYFDRKGQTASSDKAEDITHVEWHMDGKKPSGELTLAFDNDEVADKLKKSIAGKKLRILTKAEWEPQKALDSVMRDKIIRELFRVKGSAEESQAILDREGTNLGNTLLKIGTLIKASEASLQDLLVVLSRKGSDVKVIGAGEFRLAANNNSMWYELGWPGTSFRAVPFERPNIEIFRIATAQETDQIKLTLGETPKTLANPPPIVADTPTRRPADPAVIESAVKILLETPVHRLPAALIESVTRLVAKLEAVRQPSKKAPEPAGSITDVLSKHAGAIEQALDNAVREAATKASPSSNPPPTKTSEKKESVTETASEPKLPSPGTEKLRILFEKLATLAGAIETKRGDMRILELNDTSRHVSFDGKTLRFYNRENSKNGYTFQDGKLIAEDSYAKFPFEFEGDALIAAGINEYGNLILYVSDDLFSAYEEFKKRHPLQTYNVLSQAQPYQLRLDRPSDLALTRKGKSIVQWFIDPPPNNSLKATVKQKDATTSGKEEIPSKRRWLYKLEMGVGALFLLGGFVAFWIVQSNTRMAFTSAIMFAGFILILLGLFNYDYTPRGEKTTNQNTEPPVTSLLGLAKDADPHLPPIPHTPVPPETIKAINQEVARIVPKEFVHMVPELIEAYYDSHMPSYAVLGNNKGKPVLELDEHLQKPVAPALQQAQIILLAKLWIHESIQHQLRQANTDPADLTEELALFAEVDLRLWKTLSDKQKQALKKLAKELDAAEPHRRDRLGPSLERLERASSVPDEEKSWEALTAEFQTYPQFAGHSVDWNRFQTLRRQINKGNTLGARFAEESGGNDKALLEWVETVQRKLVGAAVGAVPKQQPGDSLALPRKPTATDARLNDPLEGIDLRKLPKGEDAWRKWLKTLQPPIRERIITAAAMNNRRALTRLEKLLGQIDLSSSHKEKLLKLNPYKDTNPKKGDLVVIIEWGDPSKIGIVQNVDEASGYVTIDESVKPISMFSIGRLATSKQLAERRAELEKAAAPGQPGLSAESLPLVDWSQLGLRDQLVKAIADNNPERAEKLLIEHGIKAGMEIEQFWNALHIALTAESESNPKTLKKDDLVAHVSSGKVYRVSKNDLDEKIVYLSYLDGRPYDNWHWRGRNSWPTKLIRRIATAGEVEAIRNAARRADAIHQSIEKISNRIFHLKLTLQVDENPEIVKLFEERQKLFDELTKVEQKIKTVVKNAGPQVHPELEQSKQKSDPMNEAIEFLASIHDLAGKDRLSVKVTKEPTDRFLHIPAYNTSIKPSKDAGAPVFISLVTRQSYDASGDAVDMELVMRDDYDDPAGLLQAFLDQITLLNRMELSATDKQRVETEIARLLTARRAELEAAQVKRAPITDLRQSLESTFQLQWVGPAAPGRISDDVEIVYDETIPTGVKSIQWNPKLDAAKDALRILYAIWGEYVKRKSEHRREYHSEVGMILKDKIWPPSATPEELKAINARIEYIEKMRAATSQIVAVEAEIKGLLDQAHFEPTYLGSHPLPDKLERMEKADELLPEKREELQRLKARRAELEKEQLNRSAGRISTLHNNALDGIDFERWSKMNVNPDLAVSLKQLKPTLRERVITAAAAEDRDALRIVEQVMQRLPRDEFHMAFSDARYQNPKDGDLIALRRPARFGIYRERPGGVVLDSLETGNDLPWTSDIVEALRTGDVLWFANKDELIARRAELEKDKLWATPFIQFLLKTFELHPFDILLSAATSASESALSTILWRSTQELSLDQDVDLRWDKDRPSGIGSILINSRLDPLNPKDALRILYAIWGEYVKRKNEYRREYHSEVGTKLKDKIWPPSATPEQLKAINAQIEQIKKLQVVASQIQAVEAEIKDLLDQAHFEPSLLGSHPLPYKLEQMKRADELLPKKRAELKQLMTRRAELENLNERRLAERRSVGTTFEQTPFGGTSLVAMETALVDAGATVAVARPLAEAIDILLNAEQLALNRAQKSKPKSETPKTIDELETQRKKLLDILLGTRIEVNGEMCLVISIKPDIQYLTLSDPTRSKTKRLTIGDNVKIVPPDIEHKYGVYPCGSKVELKWDGVKHAGTIIEVDKRPHLLPYTVITYDKTNKSDDFYNGHGQYAGGMGIHEISGSSASIKSDEDLWERIQSLNFQITNWEAAAALSSRSPKVESTAGADTDAPAAPPTVQEAVDFLESIFPSNIYGYYYAEPQKRKTFPKGVAKWVNRFDAVDNTLGVDYDPNIKDGIVFFESLLESDPPIGGYGPGLHLEDINAKLQEWRARVANSQIISTIKSAAAPQKTKAELQAELAAVDADLAKWVWTFSSTWLDHDSEKRTASFRDSKGQVAEKQTQVKIEEDEKPVWITQSTSIQNQQLLDEYRALLRKSHELSDAIEALTSPTAAQNSQAIVELKAKRKKLQDMVDNEAMTGATYVRLNNNIRSLDAQIAQMESQEPAAPKSVDWDRVKERNELQRQIAALEFEREQKATLAETTPTQALKSEISTLEEEIRRLAQQLEAIPQVPIMQAAPGQAAAPISFPRFQNTAEAAKFLQESKYELDFEQSALDSAPTDVKTFLNQVLHSIEDSTGLSSEFRQFMQALIDVQQTPAVPTADDQAKLIPPPKRDDKFEDDVREAITRQAGGPFDKVIVAPNKQMAAATSSNLKTISLWNIENLAKPFKSNSFESGSTVDDLAFSAGGSILALNLDSHFQTYDVSNPMNVGTSKHDLSYGRSGSVGEPGPIKYFDYVHPDHPFEISPQEYSALAGLGLDSQDSKEALLPHIMIPTAPPVVADPPTRRSAHPTDVLLAKGLAALQAALEKPFDDVPSGERVLELLKDAAKAFEKSKRNPQTPVKKVSVESPAVPSGPATTADILFADLKCMKAKQVKYQGIPLTQGRAIPNQGKLNFTHSPRISSDGEEMVILANSWNEAWSISRTPKTENLSNARLLSRRGGFRPVPEFVPGANQLLFRVSLDENIYVMSRDPKTGMYDDDSKTAIMKSSDPQYNVDGYRVEFRSVPIISPDGEEVILTGLLRPPEKHQELVTACVAYKRNPQTGKIGNGRILFKEGDRLSGISKTIKISGGSFDGTPAISPDGTVMLALLTLDKRTLVAIRRDASTGELGEAKILVTNGDPIPGMRGEVFKLNDVPGFSPDGNVLYMRNMFKGGAQILALRLPPTRSKATAAEIEAARQKLPSSLQPPDLRQEILEAIALDESPANIHKTMRAINARDEEAWDKEKMAPLKITPIVAYSGPLTPDMLNKDDILVRGGARLRVYKVTGRQDDRAVEFADMEYPDAGKYRYRPKVFEIEGIARLFTAAEIEAVQKKNLPINELEISVEAYNTLTKLGIKTAGELIQYTESELADKIKVIGKTSVKRVLKTVREGLALIGQSLKSSNLRQQIIDLIANNRPALKNLRPSGEWDSAEFESLPGVLRLDRQNVQKELKKDDVVWIDNHVAVVQEIDGIMIHAVDPANNIAVINLPDHVLRIATAAEIDAARSQKPAAPPSSTFDLVAFIESLFGVKFGSTFYGISPVRPVDATINIDWDRDKVKDNVRGIRFDRALDLVKDAIKFLEGLQEAYENRFKRRREIPKENKIELRKIKEQITNLKRSAKNKSKTQVLRRAA